LLLLLGSIILTSFLTLSFKVVERFGIPVLQAIVFNYITCVIIGSIVNSSFPLKAAVIHEPWFKWALVMGTLFVTLFNIVGFTAQKLGVAITSVANKLSLVIPFVFSLYYFNETTTWINITGIVLALVAVVFTSLPSKKGESAAHHKVSPVMAIAWPVILFFGSGLLDTLIKFVEQSFLHELNFNAYLVTAFSMAGILGGIIMILLLLTGKMKFDPRSIIAGIGIGIPNYFSIWCLVQVLKLHKGNSSVIIPVNNMGIVLFSSVVAWLVFNEQLKMINWVGILLSIGAIALIAFG
jgi:drug/metabolite transporter (DMT)-like permease